MKEINDDVYLNAFNRVGKNDIQNVFTPPRIIRRMLNNIKLKEDCKILVWYNVEFLIYLVKEIGLSPKNIYIYTNTKDKLILKKQGYNVLFQDKINLDKLKNNISNVNFNVVLGNPPYDIIDGGGKGSSSKTIYPLFVDFSKTLNPDYVLMITPSKWFSGGKGLDNFRKKMLEDKKIKLLTDYVDSRDCFSNAEIAGGVCYFIWDNSYNGLCKVETIRSGVNIKSEVNLSENTVLVRDSVAREIIRKIKEHGFPKLSETVSTRNPFNVKFSKFDENGDLMLITSKGNGLYDSNKILKNNELIPKWKVMISKTSHDHAGQPDKNGKRRVLSKIEILEPNTICSETYLIVNCYSNEVETQNMVNFLKTKVVRFLISTVSLTQNLTKSSFQFVPKLDMNIEWSDEKLYTLFNLTDNEISFINEMIREY